MDNNELNLQNNANVYQATTNLNTAIENPNVDIDNATSINIQNNLNSMIYSNNLNTVVDNNYNTNVVDMNNNFKSNVFSSDVLGPNTSQNFFINDGNNNFDNNQNNVDFNNNNVDNNVVDNIVSYAPTIKKKKKPTSGLVLPNEVKAMVVIIVILLVVLFAIPYVYDFLKELNLGIISR